MIPISRSPALPLLLACLVLAEPSAAAARAPAPALPDSARLHRLFDRAWEDRLRHDPLFATYVGDRRFDDRLPRVREADHRRRLDSLRVFLDEAEALDRSALSPADRTHLDVFRRVTRDRVRELEFRGYLMPFTTFVPFYGSFPELADRQPLATVADYEAYVARLDAFDRMIDEYVGLMRAGLRDGITIPRAALEGIGDDLAAHFHERAEESRLWAPFEDFPTGVPEGERARLREAGRRAILESVVPGYRAFHAFMTGEYAPDARTSIGASELPDGQAFYEHRVRRFTTLDVTPREVHERGLAEVERIREEMHRVMEEAGHRGSFDAFLEHLRTDDRFYASNEEELMAAYALALKRMDGQLPRLFGRLPRMPYGIRAIPDYMAPRMTTAYYSGPSADGRRAGFYYVNTYDLESRPLYEVQSLSFHEAVPGHHLQIALMQELEGLPRFRRFEGFTAFTEGWALYAERLGREVGFYQDPYDDFGRLTYEMWRACRLVVDTGIHAFGWSRERAIAFMADHTALSLRNVEAEVDRYISWPGQALGYKMGELTIRRLRSEAEEALGADFDLRAFHDTVLGSGSVPLSVLEANVERWIRERRGGGSGRVR